MKISRTLAVIWIVSGLFAGAVMVAGCSMQTNPADRPNWSLNGPRDNPAPASQPAQQKKYGDWNGPGAPKPLTYDQDR